MQTPSPTSTARTAGVLYLLLTICSVIGLIYVPQTLIVTGDIAATISNIVAHEGLFRLGIVSSLVAYTLNVFLAYYLYRLFAPIHAGASALMVLLISIGVTIGMVNELSHVATLLLVKHPAIAAVFSPEQFHALTALSLGLHASGFMIAHIFFGLWLFPMGYLAYRSRYIPRFIGILLGIAGLGYIADFGLFFFCPDITWKISAFTFIGEVAILIWLLIGKLPKK